MARTYLLRTYGCQMNEHDSERIAGLLEADGMERPRLDDADVVVLNTCCIRENADNKLYGNLGHLKAVKEARPDLQIVVAGCLAQKDRELVRERAPYVDVVFGTHNVHRAAALVDEARQSGPITEIFDETDPRRPRGLPLRAARRAARCRTPPGSRSRSAATTRARSASCRRSAGKEIRRPFDEIVREVERLAAEGVIEVTLLGQNVNSYGRDPDEAPAAVRGTARSGRRGRRHPPRAVHEPASEGSSSRHDRGDGRDARGVRAPAPAAAVRHRPDAGGDARGYTAERYLERLAPGPRGSYRTWP